MNWLTSLPAKIVGIIALVLAALGYVALRDRRLRREGAADERARHRDAGERIKEGIKTAPQFNEEGAADEYDKGKV